MCFYHVNFGNWASNSNFFSPPHLHEMIVKMSRSIEWNSACNICVANVLACSIWVANVLARSICVANVLACSICVANVLACSICIANVLACSKCIAMF